MCSFCGDENGSSQTNFFYQVTVEQILAGMEFYKNMQIGYDSYLVDAAALRDEDGLSALSEIERLSGTFCKW